MERLKYINGMSFFTCRHLDGTITVSLRWTLAQLWRATRVLLKGVG